MLPIGDGGNMDLLSALAGGDKSSIGRVDAVVPFVLDHPEQLSILIDGMESQDEVLRMRCADAAEKISISRPDLFVPLRSQLRKHPVKAAEIMAACVRG